MTSPRFPLSLDDGQAQHHLFLRQWRIEICPKPNVEVKLSYSHRNSIIDSRGSINHAHILKIVHLIPPYVQIDTTRRISYC